MRKFEVENDFHDIQETNYKAEIDFDEETLNKFDTLMDEIDSVKHTSPNVLEKIVDGVKGRFETIKYGEMGNTCISALNDMSEYFVNDRWEVLSPKEKEKTLNILAKKIGVECGINIKGVQFFWIPPEVSGYENGDGYLHLNMKYIADPTLKEDALNTLLHEARHAYQKAVISVPDKYDIDRNMVDVWKNNFDNYLSADKFGYFRYYMQPVEVDARDFAKYVLENKEM